LAIHKPESSVFSITCDTLIINNNIIFTYTSYLSGSLVVMRASGINDLRDDCRASLVPFTLWQVCCLSSAEFREGISPRRTSLT
jgi:hypothetical protein